MSSLLFTSEFHSLGRGTWSGTNTTYYLFLKMGVFTLPVHEYISLLSMSWKIPLHIVFIVDQLLSS